jgi:hypothetical protein
MTSTILESHAENSDGPNCFSGTVTGPGCTPADTPTAPYPAKTAFTSYSLDMYLFTWEPYGGTGYWNYGTLGRLGWYDDGVKQGMLALVNLSSGWLNTTVSAATTPTYAANVGQFTATSIDMHDGTNLNVGDGIWVQTCTIGVDGGECDLANGHRFSTGRISAINTSTKLITYDLGNSDFGDGDHVPVVGEDLWAGCVYAAGGPFCSRQTLRMQIFDPDQYAEVIATTRQPYDVVYTEDIDATTLFHHYGSPATGGGIRGSMPGLYNRNVVSVIPDPDRNQIIVFFVGAEELSGVTVHLAYVLDVSQAAPPPFSPAIPLSAGAVAFVGLLSRRSLRVQPRARRVM